MNQRSEYEAQADIVSAQEARKPVAGSNWKVAAPVRTVTVRKSFIRRLLGL